MIGFSKRLVGVALAVPLMFGVRSAVAQEPTVAGLWKQVDVGTNWVGGLIFFRENKSVWEGYIAKMYPKPGDPVDPVCAACTDDRKDQPVLGLRLIEKAKRDGLTYEGGTILDPRDGSTYSVELTLSQDNQTLIVRGYVGITLLGQSQEWKRLTDDERQKLDSDHVALALPPPVAPKVAQPSADHVKKKKKSLDSKVSKEKQEGS